MSTLRQAGLEATTAQVPSTQPKGTVVAQHPAAGQKLAKGAAVLLNISKAPRSRRNHDAADDDDDGDADATTPTSGNDYTGMRLSQAVQKLARAGSRRSSSTSRRAGPPVSSSRTRGAARASGSRSPPARPRQPARVPDVTGEDAATAQQDLEDAGFTVDPGQLAGERLEQGRRRRLPRRPPADGQVPKGAAVVIYVGSANG